MPLMYSGQYKSAADVAPAGQSLNWWLDIREGSTSTVGGITGQMLDALTNMAADMVAHDPSSDPTISIPLDFVENETLSVEAFVERIQNRFDWWAGLSVNNSQYRITAELTHPESFGGATFGKIKERQAREITVKYIISNDEGQDFKFAFRSGPHGSEPSYLALTEGTVVTEVEPLPEIIETPFFTTQSIVLDRPPLPPDINLVPYKNINNKLLILLNSNSGRMTQRPQPIEARDLEGIRRQYLAQVLTNRGSNISADELTTLALRTKLEFRSDDLAYRYEIFRTTAPPTSYRDFAGKRLANVVEHISGDKFATSANFLDTIIPNTSYYYCFRSVDDHGHISNPTTVFKVEMVDNNGQVYLNTTPYLFPTKTKERFSKQGRKYLYIAPSFAQTVYRESTAEPLAFTPNAPPPSDLLGTADDLIWNKNFKIRLTSRKTGKKLDINLVFKNTGVFNP